jgi:peptide-methionine (S)-S-oxide reductase
VVETISGYTGGKTENPTYDAVKHGRTGHYEALKVVYDPERTSYEKLLHIFWRNIDPFNPRGQFCDRGSQYRAAIFVQNAAQREAAEASKESLSQRTKLKIVTQILPAKVFYPAEAYHQDYYLKNPIRYRYYRASCGRDARLIEIWGAQAGGQGH